MCEGGGLACTVQETGVAGRRRSGVRGRAAGQEDRRVSVNRGRQGHAGRGGEATAARRGGGRTGVCGRGGLTGVRAADRGPWEGQGTARALVGGVGAAIGRE